MVPSGSQSQAKIFENQRDKRHIQKKCAILTLANIWIIKAWVSKACDIALIVALDTKLTISAFGIVLAVVTDSSGSITRGSE